MFSIISVAVVEAGAPGIKAMSDSGMADGSHYCCSALANLAHCTNC